MPGGQPYGAIIGDYSFDHSPPDVDILSGMAQIAAAAHAPFIAAAAPTLMNMDSWQELADPRHLALQSGHHLLSPVAGQGLNAANAFGNAGLGDNLEQTDVTAA